MSKISIRQTLLAAGAAALVGIPIIMGYVQNYPKLSGLSAFLGFVMALMTNPKVVLFVSTLINAFFPETPVTPVEPTGPVPVPPQDKQGGFVIQSRLLFLMLAAAAVLFVMLLPRLVHAQSGEQKYGGCMDPASYGQICIGPRAGALIARYDLTGPLSGKFTGGFQPGAGYEVIWQSADAAKDWKRIELGVFGSFNIGGSSSTIPNSFSLTGLITVFNYVSFGVGSQWIEQPTGPAKASFYLTGGATFNIGGSTPAQVKARREADRKAGLTPLVEGPK